MKNSFKSPAVVDTAIQDESGNLIGTVRIKPTGILWKPKNAQTFFAKPLSSFTDWITAPETKAKRTKK